MTANNTPPGVRLMTDGGTEPASVKTVTATAKGVTEREIDGEQREVLRVPISSTRADRENDRFDKEALEGMADQIRSEQPHVFDNHGLAGGFMDAIPYDSRETIGTQFDAEVAEADDGEHELFAFVNPDKTHAEGERMLKQVRDEKQAIKFSVGFGIQDEEPIEDEAGNEVGRRFLSADLMETSRVGIPANPDASLSTATAKGSMPPGYAMHPLFARMMGFDEVGAKSPIDSETVEDATPVRVDGGETDTDRASAEEVAALRGDINALREEVAELREADGEGDDDTKGPCDDNGDCPEGEVCVDGECVPEDEVDDDDDEEDAADPEEIEALRSQLDALEEELREGRGDPKTKDTATEEPDLTEEGEPDATDDTKPDERADHEYATTR